MYIDIGITYIKKKVELIMKVYAKVRSAINPSRMIIFFILFIYSFVDGKFKYDYEKLQAASVH